MPQPFLSLAYLFALRTGRVPASFIPLLVLAVFPVASVLVGAGRAGRLGLVGVAGLELVWTVLGEAIVGFAIALQSG